MLSICLALLQNPKDKQRFEEFYNKFYNIVYFIAKDHLKTKEAAEDCAQEIMIRFVHFLLAILLLSGSLMAATARTYQDALRKAGGKRPVVLFCYGANYDRVSEQAYESFIRKRGIARAVRDFAKLKKIIKHSAAF